VNRTVPTAPAGIGNKLRTVRLDQDLSIEETAWRTRIRPDVLRALEDDCYDEIGHQAFVRSHLSSYARFLGIDPADVVTEFDSGLDEPLPSSIEELERVRKGARKPPRAKWLAAAALSGVTLIVAAVSGVLGGQAERPAPDLAAAAVVVPPAVEPGPVTAAEARVSIRLEAIADTQVSVTADGEQVFEGILAEGDARTFRALRRLEILAANGGTILLANGDGDLTVAGDDGAVFRARYGPNGRLDDDA
jgi:hypothetical protein